jgi:hypothetical protein
MLRPKTLDDFPHFIVAAVRPGKPSASGYMRFELDGKFDRIIENLDPHWFWLLFGQKDCLCATLQSLDSATATATLTCDEKDEPKITGQALAYLSPCWQAYHVWMVLDPKWGWLKKQFEGIDAVATDYEAKEPSIVGSRLVKIWTKVEPVGLSRGQSRHYPAKDQTSPASSEPRLIASGWGHEHCDLCKHHIDAGNFGYVDPREHWMCETCYERYVVARDLAFVDDL